MSSTTIPAASRLEKARMRLERAVAGIEATVRDRPSVAAGDADARALRAALDESRAAGAAVAETAEDVSRRLDTVIGRMKAVLEE